MTNPANCTSIQNGEPFYQELHTYPVFRCANSNQLTKPTNKLTRYLNNQLTIVSVGERRVAF